MVPFSTFQAVCLSASFQPLRSLPLKSDVNPGGGAFLSPAPTAPARTMNKPANTMRLMAILRNVGPGDVQGTAYAIKPANAKKKAGQAAKRATRRQRRRFGSEGLWARG